jgi:hypothetical protein
MWKIVRVFVLLIMRSRSLGQPSLEQLKDVELTTPMQALNYVVARCRIKEQTLNASPDLMEKLRNPRLLR